MERNNNNPLYFDWNKLNNPASEFTKKVTRNVREISKRVQKDASEQAVKEVLRKERERTYAQRQAEKRKWLEEQNKKIEKELEEERKKEREEEDARIKKEREKQREQYDKDSWDFYDKSQTNPENFLVMKGLFELKNALGSLVDNQSKGHMTELEGKITDKDVSKEMAKAYQQTLDYQKQIEQLKQQRDLFSEAYLSDIESLTNGPISNDTKDKLATYNEYNKAIDNLQQKIDDPDLKQLSDAYQSEYSNKYGSSGILNWFKRNVTEPLFDSLASISVLPSKQKDLEQHILNNRQQIQKDRYNSVLQDRISKNGGDEYSEIERFNNDIKTEQDAYRQEYAEEAKFNQKANDHFNVAESYKKGIELYQNASIFNPYYMLYELPQMQGSSLSSKNQQKQMALQYGGLGAAAVAAPFTAGGSALIGIGSQLASSVFMLPAAKDENYVEMGDKRAANIKEILSESDDYQLIKDDLMVKAVPYWLKQGMSTEWIKKRYEGQDGETNLFQDLATGVTSSNHPDVTKALIYSTSGLRAQFNANMMRTAGELPLELALTVVQPVKAFTPYKWRNAIGTYWKNVGESFGFRSGEREITKRAARNSVGKSAKNTPKPAPSSGYNNNFDNVLNNTKSKKPYASPTVSVETPGTTWNSFKSGFKGGFVAGDVAGLGYGGSFVTGVAAGTTKAAMHMARERLSPAARAYLTGFERAVKDKYQSIYDATIGKREWTKLAGKYGYHAGRNFLIRGFSEGGEELGQYQNEIADYASKYGYNGISLGKMLSEDMANGIRNAKFYAAALGIGESPLLDDAEAVANWKGGFVLGGANSGTIQIASNVSNAFKEYSASDLIGNWGFMDRELGKNIRAQNTDMVMHIMNNRENAIVSVLEDAKAADSRRQDPEYSTEDYDEKIKAVSELSNIAKSKRFRERMEAHGIEYGTKEYATAVADYYDIQKQNDQNNQEQIKNSARNDAYYNGKEYNDRIEEVVNRSLSLSPEDNEFVQRETAKHVQATVSSFISQATEAGEDTSTEDFKQRVNEIRQQAEAEGEQNAKESLKKIVNEKSKAVNRLNALFRLKQQLDSIDDMFDMLYHKFGLSTKRQDANSIKKSINKQLEKAKEEFKIYDKNFHADSYEEFQEYISGDNTVIQSDEAEDIEFNQAILNADRSVINSYANLYNRGYVRNPETRHIEYNPEEDRYQQEESEKAFIAQISKKEYKPNENHTAAKAPEGTSPLKKRITHIIDANQRNKKLDWMLTEVYSGDAANKLQELIDEEESKYQEGKRKRQEKYIKKLAKPDLKGSKKPTPRVKAPEKRADFGKNKEKWEKRKTLAKKRYENRKAKYEKFSKVALHSTVPFEHLIVSLLNKAVELIEQGVYTFGEFLEDVSSTFKYDVESHLGELKGVYIDAIAEFAKTGNRSAIKKLESIDAVMAYGIDMKPTYIVPEIQTKPLYKYVQNLFNEDQQKIRTDLSNYYDTIVDDGGVITVYTNQYALDNYDFREYASEIQRLTDANTSDESFREALKTIVHTEFPIEEFVKLREVPNIIPAIIHKKVSDTKSQSLMEAVLARNVVLAILNGNEQEVHGHFLSSYEQPFIEKIKKLKSDIDRLGYHIINTGQFIYTTTEDGKNISAEADIILMNDDGDIRIIDIFNSWRDPVLNFDNPINKYTKQTTRQKETKLLHYLEDVVQRKTNHRVAGLSALPIQISGSGGKAIKAYDAIKINGKDQYNEELQQLKKYAEELIDKLNEAVQEYNTLSKDKRHIYILIPYNDPNVYKDYIKNLQNDLDNLNTEIEQLNNSSIDELEAEYWKWVEQNIDTFESPDPTLEQLVGVLKDKCSELDMQLEFLPIARPYGENEKNNLRIIEKTLIEAQIALNDVLAHEGSMSVNLQNEEELITTAIEKFVKSAEYYGEENRIVQSWWANNFIPKPTDKGNQNEYGFYWSSINSWINTLRKNNHIFDIDDYDNLQLFYSYVLNNTFIKLLQNAEEFINSGRITDTTAVTLLQNVIRKGKDLIVDYNMQYGVEPDETYDTPAQTDVDRINRMPVKWADLYSISDKHSPAYDALNEVGQDGKFTTRAKLYRLISLMPDLLDNYYTYNNATDVENMDPEGTKFRLYKDRDGEIKLDIIYYDKVQKNQKIVYGLPFIVNVSEQPEELKQRAKQFNRGNKKFLRKVSAMLDYIAQHPEENLRITFTVTRNKGSIRYDSQDLFHNVSEFLFNDKENQHDLFNIKLGRESGIGILHKIINKRTGKQIYDVKTADNKTRIGGFDDEYKKQHLNANSGAVVYFYKNGDGTNIGVVMRPRQIGEKGDTARRLVRLIERYIQNTDNGKTLGYSTIDLIKQCLYVNDGLKKLSEFQKTTNMVTISKDGTVMVGQDVYDIATQKEALIQRIAQMEFTMDQDVLNEQFRSSENNILHDVRVKFVNNPSLQKETLPNGFEITREDIEKNSTWLGYVLRNGYLGTTATGKKFRQINIGNLALVSKDQQVEVQPERVGIIDQNIEDVIKQNIQSAFDGLFMTGTEEDIVTRTEEETDEFKKAVKQYFKKVLGENSKVKFDELTDGFLPDSPNALGYCAVEFIKLSRFAPYESMYHEAFHKILELMLPDKQRESFYKMYRSLHSGEVLTDRDVAEGLADMFTDYMINKNSVKNVKGIAKIKAWFNKVKFLLAMTWGLGLSNSIKTFAFYHKINAGKFANNEITKERSERFKKLFGNKLFYTVENNDTKNSYDFKYLADSSDVSEMIRALGLFFIQHYLINGVNKNVEDIKIDAYTLSKIEQKYGRDLKGTGKNDNELTLVNLAWREIFQKSDIIKKDKKGKSYHDVIYPAFDALQQQLVEYVSFLTSDYKGKIKDDLLDDEDERVQKQNIDKYDRASYEFNKLDSVTKRVKLFFATIPYVTFETVDNEGLKFDEDFYKKPLKEREEIMKRFRKKRMLVEKGRITDDETKAWRVDISKNKFLCPSFIPIEEVYNVVVNDMHGVATMSEFTEMLHKKAQKNPMYAFIYNKWIKLYDNVYKYDENGNIIDIDYDNESFCIQIFSAIKSNKNDFVICMSNRDPNGNKTTEIKKSSMERDSRQYSSQWTHFLTSGQVGVFKNVKVDGKLQFRDDSDPQIFAKTANWLMEVRQAAASEKVEDVTIDGIVYNFDKYEDIERIKSLLIRKLNNIGILFSKDALDYMLDTKYSNDKYGLHQFLSEQGPTSILSFINKLNDFVDENNKINQDVVEKGYAEIGFIKMLGDWQGSYNRNTVQQMSLGLNGKKLYSISQNNSITHIINALNTRDKENTIVRTLMNFGYNITDGTIPQGSIILKAISEGKDQYIQAHTYIGFRTDNRGDKGTEYTDTQFVEDYIAKMTMLQQGWYVFPTLADKGTWLCLSGINIPGLSFLRKAKKDESDPEQFSVKDAPTIVWTKNGAYLRPSNKVLDQMIEYAKGERLAIQQCMEDLGYDDIPGYTKQGRKVLSESEKIKNYHTPNKDKKTKKIVEPNGTRFLSLTQVVVREGDSIRTENLNDPSKSSKDMLEKANKLFFDKPLEEQREIMALTLYIQNNEAIKELEKHNLIERTDIKWMNNAPLIPATKKAGLLNITTTHFDERQIEALTEHFMNQMQDQLTDLPPVQRQNLLKQQARSLAIAAIIGDVTNRSIICSQETHRCFSGHPAMFKVDYDFNKNRIKDSTYDIQKRIGGMISTGEDNVTDLPMMRKTYVCAECKDYEVSSTSDVSSLLEDMFIEGEVRDTYAEAVIGDPTIPISKEKAWSEAYGASDIKSLYGISEEIDRKLDNAKIHAKQYAKSYHSDDINVADGAAYITDKMCEDMLRMRGAYNDDVARAFGVLRDENQKYSWKDKKEAWDLIYNKVNIVTTKYTAYGFREHNLNKETTSDVAVPYYNKFALFPVFPCTAYGHMKGIYEKMLNEGVDMLLMTSAVKVGSQGAVEYKDGKIDAPFNKYEQEFGFLRRQLNTDPEEGDAIAIGTQMVKIVLQNLRLYRADYVINPETGETASGQQLLDGYMHAIRELAEIGYTSFKDKFTNEDGSINPRKLSNYLKQELTARNASKAVIESIQVITDENGVEKLRPLSVTTDAYWIESILISAINKAVIDINTPGSSFIQRSIFAVEGKQKDGEGGILSDVDIQNTTINGGKKLQMINEEGSMDAVVSIDFFEDILPKGLSFNEARQWLIEHEIIGPKAKANTIGYRIPTQAQSSIHALRFVDVIAAEKSSIMLPEEFTKITGSDFDIDHLYLFRYNYTFDTKTHPIYGTEVKRGMTTDFSKYKDSDDTQMRSKYLQNTILDTMMVLLKDKKSFNSLYKSIDNDTDLITSIAELVEEQSSTKHLPYNFGALHEQVLRRNDYITGKKGIGPFALNVTNQILTYLYGVKFKDTNFTISTGIHRLDHLQDADGNYISSWLSAFINAHVDIVKDPYISRLNVNPFTYNMLNLLIRCGFGDTSVWFLCQPIIKQLAEADINAQSQFGRDVQKGKSIYQTRQDAKKEVLLRFMNEGDFSEDIIKRYTDGGRQNDRFRINIINDVVKNKNLMKAIALNPNAETVTVDGVVYDVKEVQKQVYYAWKTLEKYSIALSELVQHTKIDTRKHGKSFIEILDYLRRYNKIFHPAIDTSLFDMESLHRLINESWIETKTQRAISLPFEILGGYTFNANGDFTRCLMSMVKFLETEENKVNTDTVNFLSRCLQTLIKSIYFTEWAKNCLLNEKGQPMTDADFTRLFIGNYSIHNRLNMLKYHIENNPKYAHLKTNSLIQQIRIQDSNKDQNKPQFITIADNVDDSKINSDRVIDGWEDLLNDPDPTVRKFANDLILYAFLTSGEFNGWNKLLKYVPPKWLFGQYTDNYESYSDFIERALSTAKYDPEYMLEQIVSNNFQDYRLAQRVSIDNEDGSKNYEFIGTAREVDQKYVCVGKTIDKKQISDLPRFISIKVGKGYDARVYNVYKLAGTVLSKKGYVPVYVMIKKRGFHEGNNDIYEYFWNFDYTYNSNRSEYSTKSGYKFVQDVTEGYIDEQQALDYAGRFVNDINIGSDESAIATDRTGYEFMEWSGMDQDNELIEKKKGNDSQGSTSQEIVNILTISNKTEDFGVEISTNSEEFWNKIKNGWQNKNPQGIVAYRRRGSSAETFTPATVEEGWIGNPFSVNNRGSETVQQFYDWIVTGDSQGNENATDEFRQAIIEKILDTPDDAPILYYKELGFPSHATVIGYLVNNKHLLTGQTVENDVNEVKRTVDQRSIVKTINTLEGKESEFSEQEKKSIKSIIGNVTPKVLVASEHSDPVWHAEKIKKMVEEELTKPASQRKFHMMYLITKHDGLPLKELAQLKIPKFIHFSITSLGGTKYEPGVMKMDDMLDRIKALIDDGTLNPNLITIRIDPIIPGVTMTSDIEHIVQRAKSMGINQFKFSIMDSYGYTSTGERTNNNRFIIQKMEELGYNWDTYYGRNANGVVNFDAKQEYLTQIYKFMDDLAGKYNIWFNTCGEKPVNIEGLSHIRFSMGCVNVQTMNAAMGTTDIAHTDGNQRTHCSCYGNICDALRYDDHCASSCVYCYAKHNKDRHVQYYNKDGTLKDNKFTRTTFDDPDTKTNPILRESQKPSEKSGSDSNLPGPETKINIYAGTGENADLSNFAERSVFVNHVLEYDTPLDAQLGQFRTVEGAFHAQKLRYAKFAEPDKLGGIKDQIADKLRNSSGPEARRIGKQIPNLDKKAWDANSSRIMKALIKASFEQNPQALQRLLSTGNATLTHTQDKGKWGKEFPRILMEVREELRQKQQENKPYHEQC